MFYKSIYLRIQRYMKYYERTVCVLPCQIHVLKSEPPQVIRSFGWRAFRVQSGLDEVMSEGPP